MPKRVVFVLPALSGGGAEWVILQIAGALDRQKFEPILVVLNAVGAMADRIPPGISVIDLKASSLRRGLLALRRALAEADPDAIVSTMGYLNFGVLMAIIGAVKPACRIVAREANMPAVTIDALRIPLLARLGYRYLYNRATAVLCNSRRVADELTALGVKKDRLHLVPNPVDEDGLRKAVQKVTETSDTPYFVAAGRLVPQKGFDRLIEWLSQNREDRPPFTIRILGDGPMKTDLERQIAEADLQDTIRLEGFSDRPWRTMANARAYLLPSRWEGMSNSALESLAVGTPVIAHRDAGGIAELAEQAGVGAVQVADSGEAFIEAMKKMVTQGTATEGMRGSLLPAQYRLNSVTSVYQDIIAG